MVGDDHSDHAPVFGVSLGTLGKLGRRHARSRDDGVHSPADPMALDHTRANARV